MKKILLGIVLILLFLAGLKIGVSLKERYFQPVKETHGQVNFLILGINGNGGGDADLTDSLIFLSLNRHNRRPSLISLPRDLWIDDLKAKINTAYHYGGKDLAQKTMEKVLGQKINYVLVLDFNGFEKIIDLLGGVTVDVQRSFDDFLYPLAGREKDECGGDPELKCRYEHLHFDTGPQLMDGQTALKYVRSRNAEGEEGTDFSRSQRQQQMLKGLLSSLIKSRIYLYPKKMSALFQVVKQYLLADVLENEYGSLMQVVLQTNWDQLKTAAIGENLFNHPQTHPSKQWVLVTRDKDGEEVRQFVKKFLE